MEGYRRNGGEGKTVFVRVDGLKTQNGPIRKEL